ncbi:MAG: GAF domain-containing protein, partial [Candidatus Promineifilaceae bacterium]|nr:GAF domain-containing protein [Candidatus Promineifilaceae bacterium]
MKKDAHHLLIAAQEAVGNGEREQAIALCTQALEQSSLDPALQLDLLDTRSNSYFAIGRLAPALQDAQTMVEAAERENNPLFKVQALNRLSYLQTRQGDVQEAVETAEESFEAARLSDDKRLEALSLTQLADSQTRAGSHDLSLRTAENAAAIFHEMGDPLNEGKALTTIAVAYFRKGHNEHSKRAAQKALALCRRAGDLSALADAQNVLSWSETDIARGMELLNQARQNFKNVGNFTGQVACLHNLATGYSRLGLHRRALRLHLENEAITRQMGSQYYLAFALFGLIITELNLLNTRAADHYLAELTEMVPQFSSLGLEAYCLALAGLVAFTEQDYPKAIAQLEEGAALAQDRDEIASEMVSLVFLGRSYLADGNPEAALRKTTQAVDLHKAQGLGVIDNISKEEIWWEHSRVLSRNGRDEEAWEALQNAYQFLLDSIAGLSDEGLRRNYLNKIQAKRQLITAWLERGKQAGLSDHQLLAHLSGEMDLQKPFQRLVETGVRLNELQSRESLQAFLIEEATELSGAERVLLVLQEDGQMKIAGAQLPQGEDAQSLLEKIEPQMTSARRSRLSRLDVQGEETSRIMAPLIAQNKIIGFLYADLSAPFGRLNETDRDLLGMLAGQAAVALENAQLVEGLEEEVTQRTAELNARVDELQIINSVQQGLASEMDFQAIIDLVGNNLREIFKTGDLFIDWYDKENNLFHFLYAYEQGKRLNIPPATPSPGGMLELLEKAKQPLVYNSREENDIPKIPGTE